MKTLDNGTTSSSEGEHISSIKKKKIFTSGSFRPWSFILYIFFFFFWDSHLSNVTAEKFNRKVLFNQLNYHLFFPYSRPNFIFMCQRSERPHPKTDSLQDLRFALLLISMHQSWPSLVWMTAKLTPKTQCSLLTTTQTQSCVLLHPFPRRTCPCITSPVSCDTGWWWWWWEGGSSCLRERAPQPPVHQSLRSSTAEREDLCLYAAVRYIQTYIPARTQVRRNTCRETLRENAFQLRLRSRDYSKQPNTHTRAQSEEVRDAILQHTMRIQYRNHMLNVCRGRGRGRRRGRRWQMDRGEVVSDGWRHAMCSSSTVWRDEEEEGGQKMDGYLEWGRRGNEGEEQKGNQINGGKWGITHGK